jgi:hypothetical protein
MENIIFKSEASEEERAKGYLNYSLDAWYGRPTNIGRVMSVFDEDYRTTPFIVGSKIHRGVIYGLTRFENCRERLTSKIKNFVIAKSTKDDGNGPEPDPQYFRAKEIRDQSNLVFLLKLPYPRRAEQKERNEKIRTRLIDGAEAIIRVLNDIEDQAEIRRTELFNVTLDIDILKRKNFQGFLFSGSKVWFDSPYLASIYALVCRAFKFIDHLNYDKIQDFKSFLAEIGKNVGSANNWHLTDFIYIRKTSYSWVDLLKKRKLIVSRRTRGLSYLDAMRDVYVSSQGISKLCEGNSSSAIINAAFRKHIGVK